MMFPRCEIAVADPPFRLDVIRSRPCGEVVPGDELIEPTRATEVGQDVLKRGKRPGKGRQRRLIPGVGRSCGAGGRNSRSQRDEPANLTEGDQLGKGNTSDPLRRQGVQHPRLAGEPGVVESSDLDHGKHAPISVQLVTMVRAEASRCCTSQLAGSRCVFPRPPSTCCNSGGIRSDLGRAISQRW